MPTALGVGSPGRCWTRNAVLSAIEPQFRLPAPRRPAAEAPLQCSARRAAVIRLLTDENPKRPGAAAYARFVALRDGITVEQHVAAAGPVASGTLRSASRRGHVRLELK